MVPHPPLTPICYPNRGQVSISGRLSARYAGNRRYLKHIYETRRDWMLEPFQNRGREWVLEPVRDQPAESAWAGEYAGKWLEAASVTMSDGQDEKLSRSVAEFAASLVACQEPDGYLGIELSEKRGQGWDVWNLWNILTGLLMHYEITKNDASLQAAIKCGKWLIDHFGVISDSNNPFFSRAHDDICNGPVIQSCIHLYRITQDQIFLNFASSIAKHYPPLNAVRKNGKAPLVHVYQFVEALAGSADLAVTEPRTQELGVIESAWQDLVERHLYPTGSMGFREQLREIAPNDIPVENGEPDKHHQETCATVAWLLLNAQLYQATRRVRYVQKMEQTIYNALLAAQSMDGMKWMYYTPLRYEKGWFSGPTSCCYWSGPRGISRLPEWVYASGGGGILVNLYETSTARFLIDGQIVTVEQTSLYPDHGDVLLQIQPEAAVTFPLGLRIAGCSDELQITLNDQHLIVDSERDGYFTIFHHWRQGDQVRMKFDVPVSVNRFLTDQYGVISRGPEVLSVDQRDNADLDLDRIALQSGMSLRSVASTQGRRRYTGEVFYDDQRRQVIFTPYADAGDGLARFRTAFPVT